MFDSKATTVEKYDPITVECVQERRILDGRDISSDQGHKSAVIVNNDLYIVSSVKVEKFNNLALSWEKIAKGKRCSSQPQTQNYCRKLNIAVRVTLFIIVKNIEQYC